MNEQWSASERILLKTFSLVLSHWSAVDDDNGELRYARCSILSISFSPSKLVAVTGPRSIQTALSSLFLNSITQERKISFPPALFFLSLSLSFGNPIYGAWMKFLLRRFFTKSTRKNENLCREHVSQRYMYVHVNVILYLGVFSNIDFPSRS
jgi:hypothetical protein